MDEQYDEQHGPNSMGSCRSVNSNISDISGVSLSYSSRTYASTPSPATPTGNLHGGYSAITKTEYGNSSFTPTQWDPRFTASNLPDSIRWTPITLGWQTNSDLLKLYKFVVQRSKEPYFELMDPWTRTQQTPAKVYLDSPENIIKGQYPCLYPGCLGMHNVFSRPADLERHYKNVHASSPEKVSFPCDYSKCERALIPFTRKDHYRDHLRDFHMEDIGSAKGEKKMDRKKWLAAQKIWVAERKISAKHWRCAKCLIKHYIAYDGWECEPCKTTCEQDRINARQKLAPKTEIMEEMGTDVQYNKTSTSSITGYNGCDTCQSGWILHGRKWVACQCQGWWEDVGQTNPVSTAVSNEIDSSMLSSNTSDAFEVTEQLQPRLARYSQYLKPNQQSGTLNQQECESSKSKEHPSGGKISAISEKDHSLDRQGMVDGNENVGSPEIAEAHGDERKELPVTRAQTTSCGGEILSNTATELVDLEDQLNTVESPSEKFLDDLLQECGDQISSSPASSFISHGSENTQSSFSSPPNFSTSSTSSPSKREAPRKRVEKDNEDEDNGENRGHKKPRFGLTRGPHRDKIQGRRLACPFHIFDSEKYCKNSTTRTKYNTCSGPGFPEWHYLKQHLGKSQSAVHIKIRCPLCLAPFKTATAVLQHQENESSKCSRDQTHLAEDDIDISTWNKIDPGVSRQGFAELPQLVRQSIDNLVLTNLDAYAPEKSIDARKSDLRNWYMVWMILFPEASCPRHPFYDDDSSMSRTKTDRLLTTFKEAVESRADAGEIKGIDDETMEKLQDCLRTAIQTLSRINQQPMSVQLPSLSPSLQPLPVPRFETMEDTATIRPPSPCRTSFTFDSNAVFLEAQHSPSNLFNTHGQINFNNQTTSSDVSSTANDGHVDPYHLNGPSWYRMTTGLEWNSAWDHMQVNGPTISNTQLTGNVLHDQDDWSALFIAEQGAASEADRGTVGNPNCGRVDFTPEHP